MESKKWWQSSGIWGALGVIVTGGMKAAGWDIVGLEQAISDFVLNFGTILAGGVALWGRIKASKRIA